MAGGARGSDRETVVAIFKKGSGKRTVEFDQPLTAAFCYGWVDVQTKRIDEGRYAIWFVPRRPGSNWSERTRRSRGGCWWRGG